MTSIDEAIKQMNTTDKCLTYGEVLGPACEIQTQEDADKYLVAVLAYHQRVHGKTEQEARELFLENVGYFSGYYDNETMARVQRLFNTAHPIFGKAMDGIPTPEEAFEMGRRASI